MGGGDKGWLEANIKDFPIISFVPQGNEEPQETQVAGPGIVHRRQAPCTFPGVRGAEKWPRAQQTQMGGTRLLSGPLQSPPWNLDIPLAFPLHEVYRSRG